MRTTIFFVLGLVMFGCDSPTPGLGQKNDEYTQKVIQENTKKSGIAGLVLEGDKILVPPGMKVISLTYDRAPGASGYWRYVLRPFREGEVPETYLLYEQGASTITAPVEVREQAKQ